MFHMHSTYWLLNDCRRARTLDKDSFPVLVNRLSDGFPLLHDNLPPGSEDIHANQQISSIGRPTVASCQWCAVTHTENSPKGQEYTRWDFEHAEGACICQGLRSEHVNTHLGAIKCCVNNQLMHLWPGNWCPVRARLSNTVVKAGACLP
jgi:hypothetical protein